MTRAKSARAVEVVDEVIHLMASLGNREVPVRRKGKLEARGLQVANLRRSEIVGHGCAVHLLLALTGTCLVAACIDLKKNGLGTRREGKKGIRNVEKQSHFEIAETGMMRRDQAMIDTREGTVSDRIEIETEIEIGTGTGRVTETGQTGNAAEVEVRGGEMIEKTVEGTSGEIRGEMIAGMTGMTTGKMTGETTGEMIRETTEGTIEEMIAEMGTEVGIVAETEITVTDGRRRLTDTFLGDKRMEQFGCRPRIAMDARCKNSSDTCHDATLVN